MNKNKLIPVLLIAVIFIGAFAVISNGVAADASSTRPWLSMRISGKYIQLGESTDHWFYVTNPSWAMERVLSDIAHSVELVGSSVTVTFPNGTVWTEYDLHTLLPERWNPIIKPGERVLVFFLGWMTDQTGYWKFTYTFEAELDGRTYILAKTFWVFVSD